MKNKLIILLSLFIVLFLFDPLLPFLLNSSLSGINLQEFMIQIVAVGIGVFGGMQATKHLENQRFNRDLKSTLDAVCAELQFNRHIIDRIKELVGTRPSKTFVYKTLQDKFDAQKVEEDFISNSSPQITDKAYLAILADICKMPNRALFEKIVNNYYRIMDIKFVLQLKTLPLENPQDDVERKIITDDKETSFNNLEAALSELIKQLTVLIDETRKEVSKYMVTQK